jgi:8-oxo-dGTP diphosphatase
MERKLLAEIKEMQGLILEIGEKKEAVTLCVFVNDKQEVLIFKRHPNESTNPGKWGFVGGHIEKGETHQQALSREIKEETKLNFSKFKYLDAIKFDDLEIFIYCKKVKKNFIPKLNREHINWNWFTLDNLPTPIFDNVKTMAKKAFNLYGIKKNINEDVIPYTQYKEKKTEDYNSNLYFFKLNNKFEEMINYHLNNPNKYLSKEFLDDLLFLYGRIRKELPDIMQPHYYKLFLGILLRYQIAQKTDIPNFNDIIAYYKKRINQTKNLNEEYDSMDDVHEIL